MMAEAAGFAAALLPTAQRPCPLCFNPCTSQPPQPPTVKPRHYRERLMMELEAAVRERAAPLLRLCTQHGVPNTKARGPGGGLVGFGEPHAPPCLARASARPPAACLSWERFRPPQISYDSTMTQPPPPRPAGQVRPGRQPRGQRAAGLPGGADRRGGWLGYWLVTTWGPAHFLGPKPALGQSEGPRPLARRKPANLIASRRAPAPAPGAHRRGDGPRAAGRDRRRAGGDGAARGAAV
jgi:hypothetical protein